MAGIEKNRFCLRFLILYLPEPGQVSGNECVVVPVTRGDCETESSRRNGDWRHRVRGARRVAPLLENRVHAGRRVEDPGKVRIGNPGSQAPAVVEIPFDHETLRGFRGRKDRDS